MVLQIWWFTWWAGYTAMSRIRWAAQTVNRWRNHVVRSLVAGRLFCDLVAWVASQRRWTGHSQTVQMHWTGGGKPLERGGLRTAHTMRRLGDIVAGGSTRSGSTRRGWVASERSGQRRRWVHVARGWLVTGRGGHGDRTVSGHRWTDGAKVQMFDNRREGTRLTGNVLGVGDVTRRCKFNLGLGVPLGGQFVLLVVVVVCGQLGRVRLGAGRVHIGGEIAHGRILVTERSRCGGWVMMGRLRWVGLIKQCILLLYFYLNTLDNKLKFCTQ